VDQDAELLREVSFLFGGSRPAHSLLAGADFWGVDAAVPEAELLVKMLGHGAVGVVQARGLEGLELVDRAESKDMVAVLGPVTAVVGTIVTAFFGIHATAKAGAVAVDKVDAAHKAAADRMETSHKAELCRMNAAHEKELAFAEGRVPTSTPESMAGSSEESAKDPANKESTS
jgi:hypothetical protein